jgi:hypothetical protein
LTLEEDLTKRRPVESKLRNWPKRYLKRELDLTSGPGERFSSIKNKRNSIVHFTSTHEYVQIGSMCARGMTDTTEYDSLTGADACDALHAAIELVAEIFRLADIKGSALKGSIHTWTGII